MKTSIITLMALALFCQASCQTSSNRSGNLADRFEDQMESFGESMEEFADYMEEWADSVEEWADTTLEHGTVTVDNKGQVVTYRSGGFSITTQKGIKISKKDKYLLRKFPVMNYNSLNVSRSFQVVMCDTVDSIVVKINEKLRKNLVVRYNKGCLEIGLNHVNSLTSEDVKCGYVYLPYNLKLRNVDLSGTSVFFTKLPITVGSFELDMSGATKFVAPSVNAKTIEIDLSGTSTCKANLKATNIEIDMSGATHLDGNMTAAANIDVDLGGTSKIISKVSSGNLNCELSGASDATIDGTTKNLILEVSGTSDFRGSKLATESAECELTGASSAEVNCSKLLNAEISGTSSLYYSGNPKTEIEKSRSATVRKR